MQLPHYLVPSNSPLVQDHRPHPSSILSLPVLLLAASGHSLACLMSLLPAVPIPQQTEWLGIPWKMYSSNYWWYMQHMLLSYHHLLKSPREKQNSLVSFFHLTWINIQGEGKSYFFCFLVAIKPVQPSLLCYSTVEFFTGFKEAIKFQLYMINKS